MKQIFNPAVATALILSAFAFINPAEKKNATKKADPKIQVAVLLDVSNSMDGLIDQARAQLWNMVNTLGKAKCDANISPKIEIALYEYGRSTNNIKQGYVKQINGFISDLDSLSQNLFSLTTNGGDEFCGHVIFSSLKELQWDQAPENYKVIFIAGNEDFLQGDIIYTKACNLAKEKGVIVNTIYCGDKMQGIQEHWNLAGECGNGSFSNINQNAKEEEIPTPYDSLIYTMNNKLNRTYIAYGYAGAGYKAKQEKMDMANAQMSYSAGIKRINTKSNATVYNNYQWDLVDAKKKDGDGVIDKLDKKQLPDSLKNKTTAELKRIVEEKSKERSNVQKEIAQLNAQRDTYIAAEKSKMPLIKTMPLHWKPKLKKLLKSRLSGTT
jgi:hypothetical protein